MGRGRAKAKQDENWKYSSPQTDFQLLQRELSGTGTDRLTATARRTTTRGTMRTIINTGRSPQPIWFLIERGVDPLDPVIWFLESRVPARGPCFSAFAFAPTPSSPGAAPAGQGARVVPRGQRRDRADTHAGTSSPSLCAWTRPRAIMVNGAGSPGAAVDPAMRHADDLLQVAGACRR